MADPVREELPQSVETGGLVECFGQRLWLGFSLSGSAGPSTPEWSRRRRTRLYNEKGVSAARIPPDARGGHFRPPGPGGSKNHGFYAAPIYINPAFRAPQGGAPRRGSSSGFWGCPSPGGGPHSGGDATGIPPTAAYPQRISLLVTPVRLPSMPTTPPGAASGPRAPGGRGGGAPVRPGRKSGYFGGPGWRARSPPK
jgi:hypothetical protein